MVELNDGPVSEFANVPSVNRLDLLEDGPAKERLEYIRQEFFKALEFPNEWIPARYRDRKSKRRSIAFLMTAVQRSKNRTLSAKREEKIERGKRLKQLQDSFKFHNKVIFREDEDRAYAARLRFLKIIGVDVE